MATALDVILKNGIIIASDTGEYADIAPYNPTDATTNPSLVFQAISKPQYAHIVVKAVEYATARLPSSSIAEQTELALDRALVEVGAKILDIIPGRASVSVDPRLAYDEKAIITKGKKLVSLFSELNIPSSRILIKIPATSQGILAARALESQNIHVNMTLIFSPLQAIACAQAGASVISPFVGRVLDWHLGKNPGMVAPKSLSQHPGIMLVREIRKVYEEYGYGGKTKIMAAGFRTVDEVIEIGKVGGPDMLTLPPSILEGLQTRPGISHAENSGPLSSKSHFKARTLPSPPPPYIQSLLGQRTSGSFDQDIKAEGIAFDKVPEGLEKFSVDAKLFEATIKAEVSELVSGRDTIRSGEGC